MYREGDPVDGVYFIRDGEITLTKKTFVKTVETLSVFSSSPLEFTAKIPKKNLKRAVDVKIIIKGSFESIGGNEILQKIDTRQYSCIVSSGDVDLYYMSKANFLTRVQNLDLIKEMLETENFRIMERYKELCEIEEDLNKTNTRYFTPCKKQGYLDTLKKCEKKSFGNNLRTKRSYDAFNKSPKISYLRQMTEREINEAVNGRSGIIRKYVSKNTISSCFRPSLDSFLSKSRKTLLKN